MKKDRRVQCTIFLFLILSIYWILLQLGIFDGKILFNHSYQKNFGAIYGIIALIGAIWGFKTAKLWGGMKSVMGKSILMFSMGLLAQEFGQISLSYLDFALNIQGAYPSIGDIGYFGSIPLYILGIYYLARASGVVITRQSIKKTILTLLFPVLGLLGSYSYFLKGYVFDWAKPINIFLDFGYPLGQGLYVSLSLLTYALSHGVLGGIMKRPIRFILAGLVVQYFSDFSFLYVSSHGGYSVGSFVDLLYLISYTMLTLGLLQFKSVYDRLQSK